MGLHRSRVVKRLGDNWTEGIEFPQSKSFSKDNPLHQLCSSAYFSQRNTLVVSELTVHCLEPESLTLEHSLIRSPRSIDKILVLCLSLIYVLGGPAWGVNPLQLCHSSLTQVLLYPAFNGVFWPAWRSDMRYSTEEPEKWQRVWLHLGLEASSTPSLFKYIFGVSISVVLRL